MVTVHELLRQLRDFPIQRQGLLDHMRQVLEAHQQLAAQQVIRLTIALGLTQRQGGQHQRYQLGGEGLGGGNPDFRPGVGQQ